MVTLERLIQHITPGKWAELEALDKEYDVVESRFGFPPKKRYQLLAGPDEIQTLVIERQWPSLAAMEAAYEKIMADSAYQTLTAKSLPVIRDNRWELYTLMP
jgi:hypothetical protein